MLKGVIAPSLFSIQYDWFYVFSSNDLAVLFVGREDHAQCAHMLSAALRDSGVWSEVIVELPHHYGYDYPYCEKGSSVSSDSKTHESVVDEFACLGNSVKWLFCTDSEVSKLVQVNSVLRDRGISCLLGVLHIGTAFRSDYQKKNDDDIQCGVSLRFVSPDSMHLNGSLDDISYPYVHRAPFDPEDFFEIGDRLPVIVHSPSRRSVKGTREIISVLNSLYPIKIEKRVVEGVSHAMCVDARSGGHIFVDQLSHIGGFGYSSVESALQGMVPIASLTRPDGGTFDDWDRYGIDTPPILDASTPEDLRSILVSLINDREYLEEVRMRAYTWVTSGSVSRAGASKYYSSILIKMSTGLRA